MSRPMQEIERQLFAAHYGYPHLAIPVALVVMVHQDKSLQALDTKQPDAIFSVTCRCGLSPLLSAGAHWG